MDRKECFLSSFHKMSEREKCTLLAKLVMCYRTLWASPLTDLLLEDKFDDFQQLVAHMAEVGDEMQKGLKKSIF